MKYLKNFEYLSKIFNQNFVKGDIVICINDDNFKADIKGWGLEKGNRYEILSVDKWNRLYVNDLDTKFKTITLTETPFNKTRFLFPEDAKNYLTTSKYNL